MLDDITYVTWKNRISVVSRQIFNYSFHAIYGLVTAYSCVDIFITSVATSYENLPLFYSTTNKKNQFITLAASTLDFLPCLVKHPTLFFLLTAVISYNLASIKLSDSEQLLLQYKTARPFITLKKADFIQSSNAIPILKQHIGKEKWDLLNDTQRMNLIDTQLEKTSNHRLPKHHYSLQRIKNTI